MAAKNILELIAEYASSGETGTVMAVFVDNSMGRFYFTAGVLVTARYRSKEGDEALKLASGLDINNVRLHENADLVRSSQLIDPGSVIVPTSGDTAPPPIATPAASAPGVAPVTPASSANGQGLSHVAKASLSDLLADYLGPVASVIMADLPANASVDQALDMLSTEISDSQMATRFVRDARRILQGI